MASLLQNTLTRATGGEAIVDSLITAASLAELDFEHGGEVYKVTPSGTGTVTFQLRIRNQDRAEQGEDSWRTVTSDATRAVLIDALAAETGGSAVNGLAAPGSGTFFVEDVNPAVAEAGEAFAKEFNVREGSSGGDLTTAQPTLFVALWNVTNSLMANPAEFSLTLVKGVDGGLGTVAGLVTPDAAGELDITVTDAAATIDEVELRFFGGAAAAVLANPGAVASMTFA